MKKFIILLVVLGLGYFFWNDQSFSIPDEKKISEGISQIKNKVETVKNIVSDLGEKEKAKIILNSDADSNIAMVGVTKGKSSFVALKKGKGANQKIDKIMITTESGKSGIATLGENHRLEKFEINGYTSLYKNYTDTTVEVEITAPDGTVKKMKDTFVKEKKSFALISTAYASAKKENINFKKKPKKQTDGEYLMDSLMEDTMGTIQVLACGASIPAMGFGVSIPVGLSLFEYGCVGVVMNQVEGYFDIPPCVAFVGNAARGDLDPTQCMEATLRYIYSELGNRRGPSIGGIILDSETEKPLDKVNLKLFKGDEVVRNIYSKKKGHYFIPRGKIGEYKLEVKTAKGKKNIFKVMVTDRKIRIENESADMILDKSFDSDKYFYFKKVAGYFGRELSLGHNVRFDILSGASQKSFNGSWEGFGDSRGAEECRGHTPIIWSIKNNKISGFAKNDGVDVPITGRINAQNGIMTGEIRIGFVKVYSFSGKLEDKNGQGTWSDLTNGCKGYFSMNKKIKIVSPGMGNEVAPVY